MQLPIKPLRYRWVVLAVIWLSYVNVMLTRLSVGPLAPFLKEAFALSNAQLGSLVSAASIGYAPSLIICGWLVDRLGVHRMLTGGTLLLGIAVTVLFFTPSFQFMWFLLLVAGFGAGAIFPSAVKAIIWWFPIRERATAVGLNQTSVNVGGIIGAALLPTVALTLGWRYGFLFVGLAALGIFLCCALLYRNPPQDTAPVAENNQSVVQKISASAAMLALIKSRDIWMLGLATLFLGIIEFSAMAYMVLYLKESLFYGVVAAGGLLAMTEAAGGVGKPVVGFISDRLLGGRRKVIFLFMPGLAAIVCLLLGLLGAVLGWLLYPVLIILGVVAIGWGGLYATMAGEIGGKNMAGASTGITAALIMLGAIVGPPLFGFIVDQTGSFGPAWLVLAISGVVSLFFASLIREPRR